MTPKQKMLFEAMTIENETAKVSGQTEVAIDTESYGFINEADDSTKYELSERIERAKSLLALAKERKQKQDWLATEEGQAYSRKVAEAERRLSAAFHKLKSDTLKQIEELVNATLGDQWGVGSFSDTQIEIGIIDTDKPVREDGTHSIVFGHHFTLYIGWDYLQNNKRYEINFGCMGSFDPVKDTVYVALLQGIAKFATDSKARERVLSITSEYLASHKALTEEYKNIKNATPFNV